MKLLLNEGQKIRVETIYGVDITGSSVVDFYDDIKKPLLVETDNRAYVLYINEVKSIKIL